MRNIPFLLLVLLLYAGAARAQALDAYAPAYHRKGSPALSQSAPVPLVVDSTAPHEYVGPERDRVAGAGYGAALGALVGGIGFAAANYAFTASSPRDEYTVPSLFLGAAVGGTAGLIVGAIVGIPSRDAGSRSGAQVHLDPRVAHRDIVMSLSVPLSW